MKRIAAALGIGVLIGFALVMIRSLFDIDAHAFSVGTTAMAVLIVAGAILYDIFYTMPLRKKVLRTMKLMQEGKPEECIEQINEQLAEAQRKKSRNTAIICRLNLAAAYLDLKRYEEALAILEELSGERLNAQAQLVQSINLCFCYFCTDQTDKAMELYSKNKKLFASYRNHKYYGGNIAVLEMLADITHKDYPAARQTLDKAKARWDDPRLQDIYALIEDTLCTVQTPEEEETVES